MAKVITVTDQNVALNGNIPFNVVSIPCNKCRVVPIATGVLNLRSGVSGPAKYDVRLEANVAISEGGAVTPIAVAIMINGVAVPDSVAIGTPAAAGDFWHFNTSTQITVPCGCCLSVSAAYVDGTEDNTAVTPTPSVLVRRNASLTVT